jgi:hypothetical protein
MAQNLVNNNYNSTHFPFEFVSSEFGRALGRLLGQFEEGDMIEPRVEFAAALNTVLVWSGAATATLPSWEYFKTDNFMKLINILNKWSRQVPPSAGTIEEIVIIHRPQIYRSGNVIDQGMIARRNCERVRVTTEPPVGDGEIGLELDMYPANVEYFETLNGPNESGFSIWEAGSHVLLYAEVFSVGWLLELGKLREFLEVCEERVSSWNRTMEKLGLVYRVYGTMDWHLRSEEGYKADNTLALFGKRFVGVGAR